MKDHFHGSKNLICIPKVSSMEKKICQNNCAYATDMTNYPAIYFSTSNEQSNIKCAIKLVIIHFVSSKFVRVPWVIIFTPS